MCECGALYRTREYLQPQARCFTYLPFFLHANGISLVGVELDGGLAEGDEVDVPPTQDGEGTSHSHTHKEHNHH